MSGRNARIRASEPAPTIRSCAACRYTTGVGQFCRLVVASTLAIARTRAASTAGDTDRTAVTSACPIGPRPCFPSSAHETTFDGTDLNIHGAAARAIQVPDHPGGRTKDAHNTTPRTARGSRVASISASGPENDSPTTTQGPRAAASSTIGSNSAYPRGSCDGYATTSALRGAGNAAISGPNRRPVPSSPGRRKTRICKNAPLMTEPITPFRMYALNKNAAARKKDSQQTGHVAIRRRAGRGGGCGRV